MTSGNLPSAGVADARGLCIEKLVEQPLSGTGQLLQRLAHDFFGDDLPVKIRQLRRELGEQRIVRHDTEVVAVWHALGVADFAHRIPHIEKNRSWRFAGRVHRLVVERYVVSTRDVELPEALEPDSVLADRQLVPQGWSLRGGAAGKRDGE